jgi:DNA-directed RNA polymerase
MDLSTAPLELQLAHERFERIEQRTAKNFDIGDTHGALAVAQEVLPRLADAITAAVSDTQAFGRGDAIKTEDIALLVKALDPDLIALCVLQSCLSAIGDTLSVVDVCMRIGKAVNGELWADALDSFANSNADGILADLVEDPDTQDEKAANKALKLKAKAAASLPARVEAAVRRKHGGLKQRLQAARSIARRAGFEWKGDWSNQHRLRVGMWLLDIALETLPDVFETHLGEREERFLAITEGAMDVATAACQAAVCSNPYYVPEAQPPIPWTDWNRGGPNDGRVRATLVRSVHRETSRLVRNAIASGQMKPALDAINTVQATAWKINTRVLGVMRACIANGIEVEGIPNGTDIPILEHSDWDAMDETAKTLWKIKASEVKAANRTLRGDRISLVEDMAVAEQLAELPAFWTAYNMDWRGRVYALPHFNFQRSDRVRALFLFAEGLPIGEEGLRWLKIHLANCGDFEKVSKRSYDARVEWVEESMERIQHVADYPMSMEARAFWTKADQPFLFLASCFELTSAMRDGPSFISALPVSWDGSCSGLQHLCAMTRASEGAYVNLTDGDEPQDVYQVVAEEAAVAIAADADKGETIAKRAMKFGVNRKVVKRNVMTFAYSSKKAGMANQQDEDLMEPLRIDVLKGKLDEHPFGEDAKKRNKRVPSYAARYLAKQTYEAITAIVKKPAEAMGFLQALARAVAHEGKALEWTTPLGLPWVNRYHVTETKRVRMWMHDRGVKVQYEPLLTVGSRKEIDKDRASNGVAPNFVHACDGAHLGLTVNAGAREGMNYFALVHDSFGCHAAWAGRFQGIIREQFVEMYEKHDVLAEVFERAKCVLSEPNLRRLPDRVEYGPLNIKEVLNAKYAFA